MLMKGNISAGTIVHQVAGIKKTRSAFSALISSTARFSGDST
jgi:hypothetical protein